MPNVNLSSAQHREHAWHVIGQSKSRHMGMAIAVTRPHLVNTDLSCFRLTSVYRALAIVASGVRPWHLMSACSKAILHLEAHKLKHR